LINNSNVPLSFDLQTYSTIIIASNSYQ